MTRAEAESAMKQQASASEVLRDRMDRQAKEKLERTITELQSRNADLERAAATFKAKADQAMATL
jgi:uncharacterized protein HemY